MSEASDPRPLITIRIRDLRRERSLTQEALADALGISRQSVNAMEAGRCLPSLPVAMQIADFFSVPLTSIFFTAGVDAAQAAMVPWSPVGAVAALLNRPAVNVAYDQHFVTVSVRLPGYTREEIELSITEDVLSITVPEVAISTEQYASQEFAKVPFHRTIQLPTAIEPDSAAAEMKDGILTVKLPRPQVAPRTARISIS